MVLKKDCFAYIQLFVGWTVLCLCTLALCIVPESAVFYGLSHQIDNVENIVIYGFMILVEISIFFVLLVIATLLMSLWKHAPCGVGLIHLIVDPALVSLVVVPVLTVRGLATAQTISMCFHGHPGPTNAINGNGTLAAARPILPPGECSDQAFDRLLLVSNSTILDMMEDGTHDYIMVAWVASLQCLLMIPLLLRSIRYRWKMPWQPFLQSTIYLLVQSMDTVSLEATILDTHPQKLGAPHMVAISIISIVVISIAVSAISLACTTAMTPPIYVGNQTTISYLYILMLIGSFVCDMPFGMIRLLTWQHGGLGMVSGIFPFLLLKNVICLLFLLCMAMKKLRCVATPYQNLSDGDSIRMIVQDDATDGDEDGTLDEFV